MALGDTMKDRVSLERIARIGVREGDQEGIFRLALGPPGGLDNSGCSG